MGRKRRKTSAETPGPFASLFADTRGRRKRRGGGFVRWLAILLVLLGSTAAFGGWVFYSVTALRFDLDKLREVPERTLVFDRDGEILGHVSGHGENRLVVSASEVSDSFIQALLAREDSRFYEHGGVDYRGVLRAIIGNLKASGFEQGASTLTMQLARNTFEMREKSIHRKLVEVAIAKRIERNFEKDEILAFYMNRVYFGSGLYGIERASQGFFMKPASDLTLGEGAMLAGIIRGPSLLNPFRSLENAEGTRDEVLDRMVAEGAITGSAAAAAKTETIALRPPDQRLATGSYTLQTVFDLLSDFLENPEDIERGGLRVHTTLDSGLQAAAEQALDGHLAGIESRSGFPHPPRSAHRKGAATKYLQGAVVSIDNSSGAIRAMVGGRKFGDSSFNRVYQAKRQVGSTFKPFLYAVAMERGMLPGVYVSDDPVRISHRGGPAWSPGNSDGTFTGLQPAAVGLIRSRNTMSVRVGQFAGLENIRDLARHLKFGEIPDSPVVYLGAFESSPMTLTSAFSTIPSGGVNHAPFLIERIVHRDGRVFYEHDAIRPRGPEGKRIFSPAISWVSADVLGKVMDEGTGRGARNAGYSAPAGGKTGTTNDYRDAWFVGFTDKITTGVWVGLDQPGKIMDKGYGSTLALPVWTEVMKSAEERYPAAAIPPPPGTERAVLCRECGQLSSQRTRFPYQMDLPPGLRPRESCRGHGGLFANRNAEPQAFPLPGDAPALPPPGAPAAEQGGVAKAIRGFGRFLFGKRDR